MTNVKPQSSRSSSLLVWALSLIASVWITLLVTTFVGNTLLFGLTLLNALVVSGVTVFLLVRPRKISVPAIQLENIPEKPPEQFA